MTMNENNSLDAMLFPFDRFAKSYWHHLKTTFVLLLMLTFDPMSVAPCPPDFSGFIPLENCTSYMYCWNGEFYYDISCPDGLKYDDKLGYCDLEEFVACTPETLVSNVFPNVDSSTDIISDASCPNFHHGRVSVENCTGYVNCVNGFETERVMCAEGQFYDIKSNSCEDSSIVSECSRRGTTTSTIPPPEAASFTTTTTAIGTGTVVTTTPALFPNGTSLYFPDWQKKKCVEKDELNIGFGDWYSYYESIYHCCAMNFLNSLNVFKNCLDFDIEILEQPSSPTAGQNHNQHSFYPDWLNRKCMQENPPHWVHSILKSKKYECCFEFFAWDFINCVAVN